MGKTDVRKAFHDYYSAPPTPELRTLAPGTFLSIEGHGAPGGPEFQSAIQGLYSVAYTCKFQLKLEDRDFTVGPLEGEWWTEDGRPISEARVEAWRWKLMIRIPDFVDSFLVKLVKQSVVDKKHVERAADVVLELVPEERCVQVMHLGPYSTEQADLRRIDDLIVREGLIRSGPHHEVYLNDPRRVPPEKVRTILRQPVR